MVKLYYVQKVCVILNCDVLKLNDLSEPIIILYFDFYTLFMCLTLMESFLFCVVFLYLPVSNYKFDVCNMPD